MTEPEGACTIALEGDSRAKPLRVNSDWPRELVEKDGRKAST